MTVAEVLDYKVADISLAEFGRKEIEIAEKRCLALWLRDGNMRASSL